MISVVFGAHNRLNTVTNQTARYAQAPADSTGTAAGMLRTFMCRPRSPRPARSASASASGDRRRRAVMLTAAGLPAATLAAARPRTR